MDTHSVGQRLPFGLAGTGQNFLQACHGSARTPIQMRVGYRGDQGVLTKILTVCTQHDFAVTRLSVEDDTGPAAAAKPSGPKQEHGHGKEWDDEESGIVDESRESEPSNRESAVKLMIEVRGTKSYPKLVARIAEIPGVISVQAGDNTTE